MLEKALLMFPSASERRPIESHLLGGSLSFLNAVKAASKASFSAVREMSFRAEQCGCLKPKEENWSVTLCKDMWAVDRLSQYKTWSLGFVLHSAAGSVCHNLVTQRGRSCRSERLWGKGWRDSIAIAGTADVPQQGPTNPEAEKINRHSWNVCFLPFCLSFLSLCQCTGLALLCSLWKSREVLGHDTRSFQLLYINHI